ncbi:hypothetical protein HNQ91_004309 [Filimonas zeae]|uniref:Lipoprotein n=1 Tax=Filimonas zeae TaxID=1737353 RepID=A0A917MXZ5_9BACT|nr:hypothetical protein [Filimonas zeae]MDR6341236.1 hypothetical protein [Filimonas zeae]GGH76683.1 hypothetical protein GCM10011379_41890 [Filimonas zeae]
MKLNLKMVLFCSFYIMSCKPGNESRDVDSKLDALVVQLDSSFIKNKNKTALELFVDKYADSINALHMEELPVFLKDTQFDYHNVGVISPFHNPLPLRKLIFDNVSNCKSLKFILNSSILILKQNPTIQDGIRVEFEEYSFYDLAKKRYEELGCL